MKKSPKNRKNNSNRTAKNTKRQNGSTIVGVLVATAFLGIVASFMVKNTSSQSGFSRSYTSVQNAHIAVNNGVAATLGYFSNPAKSTEMINALKNSAGAELYDNFSMPGDRHSRFSSKIEKVDVRQGGGIATIKIESGKNLGGLGKGLKGATAFLGMDFDFMNTSNIGDLGFFSRGGVNDANAGVNVINGDARFDGKITIQNKDVHFTRAVYFGDTVRIPGNLGHTFDSTVYAAKYFEAHGNTGTHFKQDAYFGEDVKINGGDVQFDGKVYVENQLDLRSAKDCVFEDDANLGVLITSNNGCTFKKRLTIRGKADFYGASNVHGDAYFGGALISDGKNLTFLGNVHVAGNVDFGVNNGKLTVWGNTVVEGDLSAADGGDFRGSVYVNGNAELCRNCANSGKISYFGGNAYFNGNLTAISIADTSFKKGLYIGGTSPFNNNTILVVPEVAYFASNTATHNIGVGRFGSDVYIGRNASFGGNNSPANVASTFSSRAYFGGDLTLNRGATFSDKVFVGGATTIENNAPVFNQDAYLGGILTVGNNGGVNFNGKTYLGGLTGSRASKARFDSHVKINGNVALGTLNSPDNAEIFRGGNVGIYGNLSSSSNTTLSFFRSLYINGSISGLSGMIMSSGSASSNTGSLRYTSSASGWVGSVTNKVCPNHVTNATECDPVNGLAAYNAMDSVSSNHVGSIIRPSYISPAVAANHIKVEDVEKVEIPEEPEIDFDKLAAADGPEAKAIPLNDIQPVATLDTAKLRAAYIAARDANPSGLYTDIDGNQHLVVRVDGTLKAENIAGAKIDFNVIYLVGDGGQIHGAGGNFYSNDSTSTTTIIVSGTGSLEEFGTSGDFRGYIYIDTNTTGSIGFQFGASAKIEGAIHNFSNQSIRWNGGTHKVPITYNAALRSAVGNILKTDPNSTGSGPPNQSTITFPRDPVSDTLLNYIPSRVVGIYYR